MAGEAVAQIVHIGRNFATPRDEPAPFGDHGQLAIIQIGEAFLNDRQAGCAGIDDGDPDRLLCTATRGLGNA